MFNLFPKKESVDELIEETKPKINIAAEWNELLKEVLQLRHLKEENVKLIECYKNLREQQNFLYQENEKLKKDIGNYVFEKDEEIENLKKELNHMKAVAEGAISLCDLSDKKEAQKHPMYPLHWGGCDGAASAYPEEYSKWLNEQKDKADTKKLKVRKRPLYPILWGGLDPDIHEQAKDLTIEEVIDKVKQKTPWVEEPVDWKGKTTAENLEEKFDKGEDVLDYFEPFQCPCNMCKHAREENAKMTYNNDGSISFQPSWEQTASDLALKVAKLEEKNSIQEAIIKATRGELERAREIHAKLLCQKQP